MGQAALELSLPEPLGEPWCLSFVNTVSYRTGPKRNDGLQTADHFVRWLKSVRALTLQGQNDLTERSFERCKELREAIYEIAVAMAEKRSVPQGHLMALNASLRDAMMHLRTESTGAGIRWNTESLRENATSAVGLIALSAATLLAGPRASLVRACANSECGWLFLDMSKNRSRKWCSMSDCGNVEKARRHYQRIKSSAA